MAWHAFEFHGPCYSLHLERARISSLQGSKLMGPNPLQILKDLDEFRGTKRVWVLFAGGAARNQRIQFGTWTPSVRGWTVSATIMHPYIYMIWLRPVTSIGRAQRLICHNSSTEGLRKVTKLVTGSECDSRVSVNPIASGYRACVTCLSEFTCV